MFFLYALACVADTEDINRANDPVGDTSYVEDDSLDDLERMQSLDVEALPQSFAACRPPILGFVNHVVDGDTAFIETDYGEEKVRFIGINAPELGYNGNPDACYSQASKARAVEVLDARWVWLSFDETCQDFYERTLAYVSVGLGEEDFFQRHMLLRGFAQHFPFDTTPAYNDAFAADEELARDHQMGGWSECGW